MMVKWKRQVCDPPTLGSRMTEDKTFGSRYFERKQDSNEYRVTDLAVGQEQS